MISPGVFRAWGWFMIAFAVGASALLGAGLRADAFTRVDAWAFLGVFLLVSAFAAARAFAFARGIRPGLVPPRFLLVAALTLAGGLAAAVTANAFTA